MVVMIEVEWMLTMSLLVWLLMILFDAYAEDSSQLAQQQVLRQQQEDGECLAVSQRFGRPADMFLRTSANPYLNHPKPISTHTHNHIDEQILPYVHPFIHLPIQMSKGHCRMSGGQNLRFTTGFVRFESVAFRANFAGRLAVKQPFPY